MVSAKSPNLALIKLWEASVGKVKGNAISYDLKHDYIRPKIFSTTIFRKRTFYVEKTFKPPSERSLLSGNRVTKLWNDLQPSLFYKVFTHKRNGAKNTLKFRASPKSANFTKSTAILGSTRHVSVRTARKLFPKLLGTIRRGSNVPPKHLATLFDIEIKSKTKYG